MITSRTGIRIAFALAALGFCVAAGTASADEPQQPPPVDPYQMIKTFKESAREPMTVVTLGNGQAVQVASTSPEESR